MKQTEKNSLELLVWGSFEGFGTVPFDDVLNHDFTVKGVEGLRVVGMAAIKEPPCSNTASVSYMMAELAADVIIQVNYWYKNVSNFRVRSKNGGTATSRNRKSEKFQTKLKTLKKLL